MSIAIPSAGPPSEHALIGIDGTGERKHAPTSVPPEQLMIGTRPPPTVSKSQRYGSGFHGSPVVTKVRSDERSAVGSPCGASARTSVGESPSDVTRSCSTVRQSRSAGQSGAPSANTIVAPSAPAPTTVHGPMIHPMSVAKWTTSPALHVRLVADLARNRNEEAALNVHDPFRHAGRSRRVREQVRRLRVDVERRQLAGAVGDKLVPGATTTCSSDGASRRAASRIASIGTGLPRRDDSCVVIATFASLAWSRCATVGAANPEKIGTWIAPTCAHAFEAIATSGDIGRKIATRSPSRTPSRTSASASRVTSRESSTKVSAVLDPSSRRPTAAVADGVRSAQRWTQLCAIDKRPPVNHVVHSGPRDSS